MNRTTLNKSTNIEQSKQKYINTYSDNTKNNNTTKTIQNNKN